MESLASNIAEKIALQMDYDKNKQAVIAYGLTAIMQMITIFFMMSLFGILFDFWLETILIYLGVGIIRKSTGGAHSETMMGCIIISVLSIVSLSALSRYVLSKPMNSTYNISFTVLLFILSFIIFFRRVPVDSPKKQIVKKEKIQRLRKQSFLILLVFFIISLTLIQLVEINPRFYSISAAIKLTVIWMNFTLTKTGINFFKLVDSKLINRRLTDK
ncbi:MAG: accessory gene regulator B family protein [Clostridiales bacterium]|nr:accessory gene regulator B family protein [Clostridiales bacterium]